SRRYWTPFDSTLQLSSRVGMVVGPAVGLIKRDVTVGRTAGVVGCIPALGVAEGLSSVTKVGSFVPAGILVGKMLIGVALGSMPLHPTRSSISRAGMSVRPTCCARR